MKLDEFLLQAPMSDSQFAASIGTDRTTISRIRRGRQIPSSTVMQRIIVATEGKVLPNDFFAIGERAASGFLQAGAA